MTMGYHRYPDRPRNGSWYGLADEYKAKCALAEKLGDVKLRQWCVEHASVSVYLGIAEQPYNDDGTPDFTKAAALFNYIKKGKTG